MKPLTLVSYILLATKCWNSFLCICIQFLFGRKWNDFVHSPAVIYAHPLLIIDWKKFWYSDGSSKCVIDWKMLFVNTLIWCKWCMCSTWTVYASTKLKLNSNELSWARAHWEHWHLKRQTTSGTVYISLPSPAVLSLGLTDFSCGGGNHLTASFSRFRSKSYRVCH